MQLRTVLVSVCFLALFYIPCTYGKRRRSGGRGGHRGLVRGSGKQSFSRGFIISGPIPSSRRGGSRRGGNRRNDWEGAEVLSGNLRSIGVGHEVRPGSGRRNQQNRFTGRTNVNNRRNTGRIGRTRRPRIPRPPRTTSWHLTTGSFSITQQFVTTHPPPVTTQPPVTTRQPTTTSPPTDEGGTAALLTQEVVTAISQEFVRFFNQDASKIPKYVQMGFHVCVGGCDGCLNLQDSSNAGLVPHYNHLKDVLYPKWSAFLSLADFAVLSALEASKAGVRGNTGCAGGTCSLDLPFTSGRITCPDPESPPTTTTFPKGEDRTAPTTFLMNKFGLSTDETVALMGAHSLGRAHPGVSGFDGPWDLSPTVLDSGYYTAMTRVEWTQRHQQMAGATQWVGTTQSGVDLMMLHADMGLLHQFTVEDGSANSCLSTTGCPLADTASVVQRFTKDPEDPNDTDDEFLITYASATLKMVNTADFDPSRQRTFTLSD